MIKAILKSLWVTKKVTHKVTKHTRQGSVGATSGRTGAPVILILDMWDHPTELRVSNETVWRKTAINIAETHQLTIDGIDKEKYTRPYKEGSGFWNTREIKSFFEYVESFYDEETINANKKAFLDLMGWTLEARNELWHSHMIG